MITSVNAVNTMGDRRRRYVNRAAGTLGVLSGASAAGGHFGQKVAKAVYLKHKGRVMFEDATGSTQVRDFWKRRGGKNFMDLQLRPGFSRVYERYVARTDQLRKLALNPLFRKARAGGLLGLGAAGALALANNRRRG